MKSGDTLWKISSLFEIDYDELVHLNPNLGDKLNIGDEVILFDNKKSNIEVNAYLEQVTNNISDTLVNYSNKVGSLLTYFSLFSYQVNKDGGLSNPDFSKINNISNKYNNKLIMVITNIKDGEFSNEYIKDILLDKDKRLNLIDNILNIALEKNYKDIHFDFEFLEGNLKEYYLLFLKEAKAIFKNNNILVSAALAPKTSDDMVGQWYEAHDYEGIGKIVDFVVLMTYEWGYSAGPPMAVSPYNEVEKVVKYAVSKIDSNKIFLGQNLYGYDWDIPYNKEKYAKAISPNNALDIARKYNSSIIFDEKAKSPFFNYKDENNMIHIVWFEDARSINSKFNLINKYKLRGISYWKLGLSFTANWVILNYRYDIVKL